MKISSKSKDRTGKKKSKRSKRRRDSSISSYSSSDSDDRSPPPRKRAFKKLRRSPCPADDDNRREGKKKSEKKKSRNGHRRRRRNFSSSSRSCSTCDPSYSDSARSPSPVKKKSKLGKRGRPRDRDLDRRSSLTKRKKVSRSCSTCSDYASHSDSGRSSRSPSRQKLRNKNLCNEEKTKNFKAHDGFPKIDSSDTKTNDGKAEKKRMKDIVDDVKLDAKEASSKIELPETDADGACDYGSLKEASSGMKNEVVPDAGSGSLEAEKLEMVLKFKALENFKKYLGGNKKSESFKDAERSVEAREVHQGTRDLAVSPHSGDIGPNEAGNTSTRNWTPRLSSVVILPETNERSPLECGASDSKAGQLVSRENHSGYTAVTAQLGNENYSNVSRLSSKVVSNNNNDILRTRKVSGEAPESVNQCINEAGNDHLCGDNSNIAVGSKTMITSATKMDTPSSTSNEPADGSQFQHKSFSRTHDGEMVKVSYKVYIPKSSSALARRKLQR